MTRRDEFQKMWDGQHGQQKELGLDPDLMNELERRHATNDFLAQLYEEVAELQRTAGRHKRHILSERPIDMSNFSTGIAGVLKMTFALAQLHNMTLEQVVESFHRETDSVRVKASHQRLVLTDKTRVLAFDMDDVIADLSPQRVMLSFLRDQNPDPAQRLQAEESWKDRWYREGGFCTLPAIEGAAEALREMKAEDPGALIVIISARPQWMYKRIHSDSIRWLNERNIPFDLLLFNKDKVESIFENITPAWPEFFLEDHEKNARQLSLAGVRVLLYNQPHNGRVSIDGVERVDGWKRVLEIFREGSRR